MWFETKDNTLYIHLDCDEHDVTLPEVFEQLAHSIDVTFGDLINEDYPVYAGNDFAYFEFTLYVGGYIWTYDIDEIDVKRLNNCGVMMLSPYMYNELEDIRRL